LRKKWSKKALAGQGIKKFSDFPFFRCTPRAPVRAGEKAQGAEEQNSSTGSLKGRKKDTCKWLNIC